MILGNCIAVGMSERLTMNTVSCQNRANPVDQFHPFLFGTMTMRHLSYIGLLAIFMTPFPSQAGSVQANMQVVPAEVLMFTLPACSYCKSAKELMLKKRIPFREIDLSTDDGMRTAEAMKIPPMAPVFAHKNRLLQGYTEERLLKFLEN